VGRRLREQMKKFATVFYAWIVWAKFHPAPEPDAHHGTAVLGAGRKMTSGIEFDLPLPRSPKHWFYRDLDRAVHGAGTKLLLVYSR
jgi:hypothetical protein